MLQEDTLLYDVYVFSTASTAAVLSPVSVQSSPISEMLFTALQTVTRIPGFIGVEIPRSQIEEGMAFLLEHSIDAIAIPIFYREPLVSSDQAYDIACRIAGQQALTIYDPHPLYWVFGHPNDGTKQEEIIPSIHKICIDTVDGHPWTQRDFYAVRNGVYYWDETRPAEDERPYDLYLIGAVDQKLIHRILAEDGIHQSHDQNQMTDDNFLGLRVSHSHVRALRQKFIQSGVKPINVWCVQSAYRTPRISLHEAAERAAQSLDLQQQQYPSLHFGSLEYITDPRDVAWFKYRRRAMNGSKTLYAYVDIVDGHLWSMLEFEQWILNQ